MTNLIILAVALLSLSLIIAIFAESNSTFGKVYQKRLLTISQANYCGQGDVGVSVQCTNTVSQTLGNENGIVVRD